MGRWILNALVALFLAVAFLFPYAGGAVTAYVLIVLSLMLIGWNFALPSRVEVNAASWLFLGSFSLIAIAFMLTNLPGRTDFLFAVNFAMFALYPMLATALQRFAGPNNSARVATLALVGTVIALAIGIVEKQYFHFNRTAGFAANPIPSSTIALLLGFTAAIGVFALKDWRRFIFLLGPVAGVGTVYLSGSRGPLLAVPALLLIAVIMVPIRRVVSAGVLIAIVGATSAVYFLRPTLFGRLAVLPEMLLKLLSGQGIPSDIDASGSIRSSILQGSIIAFEKAPWLGYGWYYKTTVVTKYLPWDVGFGDPLHAHLHSDILNMGVSAGVVGLLAYAMVLLAPILGAAYSARDSQYRGRLYGALVLSAVYVCCGAVNILFGFEFTTTMYVILAAILLGYCRDSTPPGQTA